MRLILAGFSTRKRSVIVLTQRILFVPAWNLCSRICLKNIPHCLAKTINEYLLMHRDLPYFVVTMASAS